jgi:FAD:protein FMN transferase
VNSQPISARSSRSSHTGSASEGRTGRETRLERRAGFWLGAFRAMASPCEVLIETDDHGTARCALDAVAAEAWRVDDKYSRYRADNIVHDINSSEGYPVAVDEETADLLDFCARLHALSGGLFDITSGVLRRAWTFDGGSHVPATREVEALLGLVGWSKAKWNRPVLTLTRNMEIDFGGIGKEYAVDRATALARELCPGSCVVNFGGDLAVSRPRSGGASWRVGVESLRAGGRASRMIDLRRGALATSGDAHSYVARDGERYTHILDPRTGWPVENAPRSVTVAAETCTQAGMLTTLAVLQGAGAEEFLRTTAPRSWIHR